MKSDIIKALCTSHGWQDTGQTWVYGVAIPKPGVDPMEVVDELIASGVIPLPGVHDHATSIHPAIATALGKYGLLSTDLGYNAAAKMHQACGMPALRPHLY